jgi:hypothetical protein
MHEFELETAITPNELFSRWQVHSFIHCLGTLEPASSVVGLGVSLVDNYGRVQISSWIAVAIVCFVGSVCVRCDAPISFFPTSRTLLKQREWRTRTICSADLIKPFGSSPARKGASSALCRRDSMLWQPELLRDEVQLLPCARGYISVSMSDVGAGADSFPLVWVVPCCSCSCSCSFSFSFGFGSRPRKLRS